MAFYNLGHGGDVILNPNFGLYPQNAYVEGVHQNAGALLRPAEHMSPAAYNIWRNIRFGKEKFVTNAGLRDWLNGLYSSGQNIVTDDILGLVTVPHEAVVRGIYYRVESPQEGTSFQLIRASTGEAIGPIIDATVARVGFVETSFVVPPDTNESIGIRIVTWPALDETDADPCGVYGPCDDLTLCFTLNVFIWSPVAEWFCATDPCYGQGRGARDDGYMGGGLGSDPVADGTNTDGDAATNDMNASAANSTIVVADNTATITVRDANNATIAGATVTLTGPNGVEITALTDGAGVATFPDLAYAVYTVSVTTANGVTTQIGTAEISDPADL